MGLKKGFESTPKGLMMGFRSHPKDYSVTNGSIKVGYWLSDTKKAQFGP